MPGNSPSQKLDTGYPVPSGKEMRTPAGIDSGLKGEHSDSPADARPTQFTPDQRDKLGDAPAL